MDGYIFLFPVPSGSWGLNLENWKVLTKCRVCVGRSVCFHVSMWYTNLLFLLFPSTSSSRNTADLCNPGHVLAVVMDTDSIASSRHSLFLNSPIVCCPPHKLKPCVWHGLHYQLQVLITVSHYFQWAFGGQTHRHTTTASSRKSR